MEPKSIREIARRLHNSDGGQARLNVQREIERAMEKMFVELSRQHDEEHAVLALYRLMGKNVEVEVPEWLLSYFREYADTLREDAPVSAPVPSRDDAEPTFSERDFARHLHREWRRGPRSSR